MRTTSATVVSRKPFSSIEAAIAAISRSPMTARVGGAGGVRRSSLD